MSVPVATAGPVGYLVDSTVVLSTSPDPSAVDVVIDSLLLAQRTPPTATSLTAWTEQYGSVLVNLGWTINSTTSRTVGPTSSRPAAVPVAPALETGQSGAATVVPWTLIRADLATQVAASLLPLLDRLLTHVPPTPPDQARRWQAQTICGPTAAAAAVAVASATADGLQLIVTISSITHAQRPAVTAYPTAPVAQDGLQYASTTLVLDLPAQTAASLPSELDPLVKAVRPSVVTLHL